MKQVSLLVDLALFQMNLTKNHRLLQIERLKILSRYQSCSKEELEKKIKEGTVPEHPGWEDLIEVKNIEAEINEIENNILLL